MKSSFYSTATFSVVLLVGATGLGQRASVAGPVSGQNKSATALQPKTQNSAAPCTKGYACDDSVVHASKLGKQEADEALKLLSRDNKVSSSPVEGSLVENRFREQVHMFGARTA